MEKRELNMICSYTILGLLLISFSIAAQDINDVRLFEKADAYYRQNDYGKSAQYYAVLVKQNPVNGEWWDRLGQSYYYLKNYDEAITAFKQAIRLGEDLSSTYYNIACCYALSGDNENALINVEQSILHGMKNYSNLKNDPDLESIRSESRFLALYGGGVSHDADRVKGWRFDIDFLKDKIHEVHYNPYRYISKEEINKKLEELKKAVPDLSDFQLMKEIFILVTKLGDGHTYLHPPYSEYSSKFKFHVLPIQFYVFADGVFVFGADENHKNLVGKKVITIEDVPVESLVENAQKYLGSDNKMSALHEGTKFMTNYEFYVMEGLITQGEPLRIKVADESGKNIYELSPVGELKYSESGFIRNGWTYIPDVSKNPLPLYLKNTNKIYWFEYLPEYKLVYFQLNSVSSIKNESIWDFAQRLKAFVDTSDVEYFVTDLRLNGGGNSYLNRAIINLLVSTPKINQYGKLFTITGRITFSAAQNLSTDLEYRTNTIFVGEPTGSKPNFIGETNRLKLPWSDLTVSLSDRYHQGGAGHSDEYRTWIAPQIYTPVTSEEFKDNVDPAMDAIIDYIKASK